MNTPATPIARWDTPNPSPFTDTRSVEMTRGSMTPVEGCVHSFFRVSGSDRYRCTHCGVVMTFEPYDLDP